MRVLLRAAAERATGIARAAGPAARRAAAGVTRETRAAALRIGLRGRRLWAAVAAAVALFTALGGGLAAASGSSSPDYRLATAGRSSVQQTIDLTGTIDPVNMANLSFSSPGTVQQVNVSVGQQVTAGELLASLDTTSLQAQVTSSEAALSAAQARLSADEASQTSTGAAASADAAGAASGGTTSVAGSSGGTSSPRGSAAPSIAPLVTQIRQSQTAVVGAQHSVDMSLAAAQADLGQATLDCQAALAGGGGSPASARPASYVSPAPPPVSAPATARSAPAPAASPLPSSGGDGAGGSASAQPSRGGAPSAPTSPSPGGAADGSSASAAACTSDLQKVAADQSQEANEIAGLKIFEMGLAERISQLEQAALADGGATSAGTAGSAASGSPGTGPVGSSATGSTANRASSGAAAGGQASSVGGIASATQLSSDEATIDSDEAQVANAQASLSGSQLLSTIDGTVAAVNVDPGQSVSGTTTAGSGDIVVVGSGTFQAETTVTDSQVGLVKIGEAVRVLADGRQGALQGRVASIGLIGTTSSTGAVTYPVTVAISGHGLDLYGGSSAQVSIVTGEASDAVAVPSSAVRTVGANHFVTVIRDGKTTLLRVTVGVVGDTLTQVTSGIQAGDEVVLAVLGQPLPTSTTGVARGLGAGAFGGGFGGGFSGGLGGGFGRGG